MTEPLDPAAIRASLRFDYGPRLGDGSWNDDQDEDVIALLDERDRLAVDLAEARNESEKRLDALIDVRRKRDSALAALAEARRKLAAIHALFVGGPDTACRTVYREEELIRGVSERVEYVEVPLDELRAALGGDHEQPTRCGHRHLWPSEEAECGDHDQPKPARCDGYLGGGVSCLAEAGHSWPCWDQPQNRQAALGGAE